MFLVSQPLLKLMNSLRISKSPIDPPPFLTNLQNFMVANVNPEFRFNEQQDAAEILQVLLNEFTVHSVTSHNLITFTVGKRITCNQCMTECLSEEPGNILQLPASNSIQSSLNGLLHSEYVFKKSDSR